MKRFIILSVLIMLTTTAAFPQGVLAFNTFLCCPPTRLGTIDGQLAGTNILGQLLAGPSPDSLAPIGMPAVHFFGHLNGGNQTVPNVPGGSTAFVKMVAWDSTFWGQDLAGVPTGQLGMTDVVPVILVPASGPQAPPRVEFTQ